MAHTKLVIGTKETAQPDGSCIQRSRSLSVLFERRWRTADELAAAETWGAVCSRAR